MFDQWLYYVLCALSSPRGGNSTPGGVNDVLLLQSGDGILLQDGSSFIRLQ